MFESKRWLLTACFLFLNLLGFAQGPDHAPPILGPDRAWTYSIEGWSVKRSSTYVYNDDIISTGPTVVPWNCSRKFLFLEAVGKTCNFKLHKEDNAWITPTENIDILDHNNNVLNTVTIAQGSTYSTSFLEKGVYYIKYWHTDPITSLRVDDLWGFVVIIKPIEKVWMEAEEICADAYPVNQDYRFKIKTYPALDEVMVLCAKDLTRIDITPTTFMCTEIAPMAVQYQVAGPEAVWADFMLPNGANTYYPPFDASGFVCWGSTPTLPAGFTWSAEDFYIKYVDFQNLLSSGGSYDVNITVDDGYNARTITAPIIIKTPTSHFPYNIYNYGVSEEEVWTPTDNPITILSGGTQSKLRIKEYLKIHPGGSLTIKDMNIEMDEDAFIEVREARENLGWGGYLKLDNSTITGFKGCNNEQKSWVGIHVFGDGVHPQTQELLNNPHSYWHGTLEMVNNATISYANFAVQTINPNDNTYTKGGGIVNASNSHFINNRKSIAFAPYKYTSPIVPNYLFPYNSSFTNCEFRVDRELERPFVSFVSGWGVRGVAFGGCTFINMYYPNTEDIVGINGYDFGISIKTTNLGVNNEFKNLNKAVTIDNISGAPSFVSIDGAFFSNNNIGVELKATTSPSVTNNQFEVPRKPNNFNTDNGMAININTGSGYQIKGNNINGLPYGTGDNTGVRISSTGSSNHLVHSNVYTNLSTGNLSNYQNTGGSATITGLEFNCNTHNGNRWDMAARGNNPSLHGMRIWQGSVNVPAGNKFNLASNHVYGIYNPNNEVMDLDYHYSITSTNQSPGNVFGANGIPTNNVNNCLYSSSPGGGVGPVSGDDVIRFQNADAQTAIASYLVAQSEDIIDIAHLRDLLDQWYSPYSDLMKVDLLIDQGEFTEANNIYNAISTNYELEGEEATEFIDYGSQLMFLLMGIKENQTHLKDLSVDQVAVLENIANDATMWAKVRAQNWLSLYDDRVFTEDMLFPGDEEYGARPSGNTRSEIFSSQALIHPNPTQEYIMVNYQKDARLLISDISGRLIQTTDIIGGIENSINVKGLSGGLYMYKIVEGSKVMVQGKLVKF